MGLLNQLETTDERPFPFSEETELLLRAYVAREQLGQKDPLFPSELGTAMSHENWRARNLVRIVKTAGIEGRVDYRIIRRTASTQTQKDGSPKDIQTLLHRTIKRPGRSANPTKLLKTWYARVGFEPTDLLLRRQTLYPG